MYQSLDEVAVALKPSVPGSMGSDRHTSAAASGRPFTGNRRPAEAFRRESSAVNSATCPHLRQRSGAGSDSIRLRHRDLFQELGGADNPDPLIATQRQQVSLVAGVGGEGLADWLITNPGGAFVPKGRWRVARPFMGGG